MCQTIVSQAWNSAPNNILNPGTQMLYPFYWGQAFLAMWLPQLIGSHLLVEGLSTVCFLLLLSQR